MACPSLVEGLIYRPVGVPNVYLAKSGHLHWIPGDTFAALGYSGAQIQELAAECFRAYPQGVPLKSVQGAAGSTGLGVGEAFGEAPPPAPTRSESGTILDGRATQGIANAGSVVQYAQSTVAKYKTPLIVVGGLWVAYKIGLFRRIF